MTSNPKNPVTIVLPDQRGPLIRRPARVFVGDVELPVKSVDVDVDLDNGDVDLTLSTQEVRIVREAPALVELAVHRHPRGRRAHGRRSARWSGRALLGADRGALRPRPHRPQ